MRTRFVDEVCYDPPPQKGAADNGAVACDVMVVLKFREQEIEPGEQADDKENYQGVGESEQEPRAEIFPERFRTDGFFSDAVGFFLNR